MKNLLSILFLTLLLQGDNPPYETFHLVNGTIAEFPPAMSNSIIVENGNITNYYLDTVVDLFYGEPHFLRVHKSKGFTSLGTLPDNYDFGGYKRYDTLAKIYYYNLQETGDVINRKRSGEWTFYGDPYYTDSIRLYHYTLYYDNDSIVGPYTLYRQNDTILTARLIAPQKWQVVRPSRVDTMNNAIFSRWFILHNGDLAAIRMLKRK